MYRKFLWYLLRERTFDPAAVQDTLHLKQALSLSDQQACPHPTPLHIRPPSVRLRQASLSVSNCSHRPWSAALFREQPLLDKNVILLEIASQHVRYGNKASTWQAPVLLIASIACRHPVTGL